VLTHIPTHTHTYEKVIAISASPYYDIGADNRHIKYGKIVAVIVRTNGPSFGLICSV